MPRDAVEGACLDALAWCAAVGYAPLAEEMRADLRIGALPERAAFMGALGRLEAAGLVRAAQGRYALTEYAELIDEHVRRERAFPRKWGKAIRLARWLARLPAVRFAAVCNTTALGAARDEADIDLFLVVRRGTVWLTRFVLAGAAALMGRRPGERSGERDAWCFSFIVDDAELSLGRFALAGGDPYFRFWFRRLLPLVDDGVGRDLWQENRWTWSEEPGAARWISWRACPSRARPVPRIVEALDRLAYRGQRRFASRTLAQAAAEGGTAVVMEPGAFKAHVGDRRAFFRDRYEEICRRLPRVS